MTSRLLLLSTEGCHLCEVAHSLCNDRGLSPLLIDIVEQQQWYDAYYDKIPVLVDTLSGSGLYWPFTDNDLLEFIKVYGINQNN